MTSPDNMPNFKLDYGVDDYPITVSDETMAQWTNATYRGQVRLRTLDQFIGVPAPILSRLLDSYAKHHA